jgi:hypothetical protein
MQLLYGLDCDYLVPVPAAAELAIAGAPMLTLICFGLASSQLRRGKVPSGLSWNLS